jgi:hypothetical protein
MLARVAALAVLVLAVVCASAAASPEPSPYSGLGTWVDIYDGPLWRDPEATVSRIAAGGARTLYLETSNYRRAEDLVRPDALARFVDAAHARGLRVVAWYLPSFAALARDRRRALTAIDFRTASGGRFDGFALDVEATVVRGAALRSARLLALARSLRLAVGARYPLGAIIPSPVSLERYPRYWPAFPYAALARLATAFLPMDYFSGELRSAAAAYAYAARSVAIIRARAGAARTPIHLIAGLADGLDTAEVGSRLFYSERTVKNIIHDVTSRLALRNRAHAVAYAIREGLI